MRPEKKQALAQFHRGQILSAAERLFQERGIESTTIDDLAKEAGYSKATLYVYFRNKDEILSAITLKGMRRLRACIHEAVNRPGDWFAAYDALCDAVACFYAQAPFAYEAAAGPIDVGLDAPETPQVFRDIYDEGERINEEAIHFLERGMVEGLLRPGLDLLQTVFLFWASLSGLVRMAAQKQAYFESALHTSKQDFLRSCCRLLLDSVLIVRRCE